MRIAILGGGPGGLFAAALLKNSDPERNVTVFERNRAEDTFGFGVVFSDATLKGIDEADPVLRTALSEHGVHWDSIEVRLRGERFTCGGNGMAAVERKSLLADLQQWAIGSGVDVRFSTTPDLDELLNEGYDLIVAADGANSRMRERFVDVFEPSAEIASLKFIWLGTEYPFSGLTFVHERGPHGVFAVHGYPIGSGVSTFIVETDVESWRGAGLDQFDASQPPGPSDEVSRAYLQELFAEQIDGHPLLVNNSRWSDFVTRGARRWRHRVGGTAIALLGDAAHTAHFSVGSGTKMAIEDAIELAAALDGHPGDVDAALATYEAIRQPQVTKIQNSARPSLSWWEHFGRAYDKLPPWQFAYNFFTRTLSESKLRPRDDAFIADIHHVWRSIHGGEPLNSSMEIGEHHVDGRVITVSDKEAFLPDGPVPLLDGPAADGAPWGQWITAPDTEELLPSALVDVADGVANGALLIAVGGGTALTRRLLCEAARLEHGAVTLLVEEVDPADAADIAVSAVLSGRTDLVSAVNQNVTK